MAFPLLERPPRDDARRLLRHISGELFALAAKLVRRPLNRCAGDGPAAIAGILRTLCGWLDAETERLVTQIDPALDARHAAGRLLDEFCRPFLTEDAHRGWPPVEIGELLHERRRAVLVRIAAEDHLAQEVPFDLALFLNREQIVSDVIRVLGVV